jgi:hypothetical protein
MHKIGRKIGVSICLSGLSLAMAGVPMGCSTIYYAAWEKLGYEKRNILVSRVEDVRDDQTKAKAQFKTAMEQLKDLNHFDGGKLEAEYSLINGSYEKCKSRAQAVSDRIKSVDNVANAMFEEWTKELDDYHDQNLRAASAKKLDDSKAKYAHLLSVMQNSETKMQNVLGNLSDVRLMLKHDLDAAAISSLQSESADVSNNVENLIKDMDASIDEANAFIDSMNKT